MLKAEGSEALFAGLALFLFGQAGYPWLGRCSIQVDRLQLLPRSG